MNLTDEEWEQVKKWLIEYRVQLDSKEVDAKHQKISTFYNQKSIQIREFLNSKTE